MIYKTANPQEAKKVYQGKPVRHAQADPVRYFTQSPHCWFSHGTAHVCDLEMIRVQVAS